MGSLKSLPSKLVCSLLGKDGFRQPEIDESLENMLKKIIGNVLNKRRAKKLKIACQYHNLHLPAEHTPAAHVIRELTSHGYEAYLVGGAVRDFLLHVAPKDFDVATNATPEQVCKLFRRSRVIGKRFPIAHVMVGRDTVEVSTFRSGVARQNEAGRIVKDNAYGTIEQDAVRRDFTCNALYYDMNKKQVIDFHNGMDDIQQKRLVMIGEPVARYQEDPVRMLRAVRLAGKLDFVIDETTAAPIAEQAHLLQKEPVARLFDELVKIIVSGHAQGCLQQLRHLGVDASDIHPLLFALQNAPRHGVIEQALLGTDKRVRAGQSVSVGFVLAALMWDKILPNYQQNQSNGASEVNAMLAAISAFRDEMERGWGVPQTMSATMREIWALQPHFLYLRGKRPFKLLSNPRFRAAYDFLLIRAKVGEVESALADWWTKFQYAKDDVRNEMAYSDSLKIQGEATAPKKKRRKPRKKANAKSVGE
ncbi:poly(A) polymerase [Alysiella filiformis DSM 16848]|uniref:Poly(A) polymerase I n=2 Tax=Alysiella TaxID=194195 RepID=A0A286EA30_9NEIS|nr:poly(A) polymerase [Alysiella filiformis DSM 16848]